jgi:hypothetical protein
MSADLEERLRSLGVGNAIESKRPMALRKFDNDNYRDTYSIVWATPEVCLCSHKRVSRFPFSKAICHGTICASDPHNGMVVSFILSPNQSQSQTQSPQQTQIPPQTHLPATSQQAISKSRSNSSERVFMYLPPHVFDLPHLPLTSRIGLHVMFGSAPIAWEAGYFTAALHRRRPLLDNDGCFATSSIITTQTTFTIVMPDDERWQTCGYSITEAEAWSHQYLGHFANFESILVEPPILLARVLVTLILHYLSSFWSN